MTAAVRSSSGAALDRFDVFGYRFGFSSPSRLAHRLLQRLYYPFLGGGGDAPAGVFSVERSASGAGWQASLDGEPLLERSSLGSTLRHLEYEICVRVIAHRADLITLHGATIATADGATLITGESNAGKSTLALALVPRGYAVGGDDIAFLDPETNMVQPLPRCSHLDRRSRRLLRTAGLHLPYAAVQHRFVTPLDLGVSRRLAAPVRQVIFTARGAARQPVLTPLAQAETAVRLLPQASWPGHPTAELVAALGRLVSGATCHDLRSGALPATVAAVAALLEPATATPGTGERTCADDR